MITKTETELANGVVASGPCHVTAFAARLSRILEHIRDAAKCGMFEVRIGTDYGTWYYSSWPLAHMDPDLDPALVGELLKRGFHYRPPGWFRRYSTVSWGHTG